MLLMFVAADAQKKKKPNVNKAKAHWDKGELAEAKAIIDDATTFEKTMNDGKTWYYRGLIYASIDTTSNDAYSGLSDNALEIAMESFGKAQELDENGKGYFVTGANGIPILMEQQMNTWYGYYFNKAVQEYEADSYDVAIGSFYKAAQIMPQDTNALTNAGYAAINGDLNDRAIEMFEMSLSRGAKSKNVILNMIRIHMENEDLESALAVVRRAKGFYPADNMLNRQEVEILRKMGKLDEARNQLELAIQNEPENALLPFFLGILYEESDEKDKAIEWYNKAVEVDASYYDAYFNKAAILYNRGTLLQKEKNLLGYSKADQKKAKELEPKIKAAFGEALPTWEKLYELKSTERDVLERLIYMYDLTGQSTKADKLEKELNALPEE